MAANLGYNEEMSAFSIPASEHSTTTMWGPDGEQAFVDNMFKNYAKEGAIFATVADSFDILNFVDRIAPKMKDRLIESGATWVIRPDSGDPVLTPINVVEKLAEHFGYEVNAKGFKVLNNVRVIQGDGINIDDVRDIVDIMIQKGWSIDNIAFGMGGGLLQKNNRDTQKFAMKCCAARIDGEWVDVYKDPKIYDPNTWGVINKQGDNGFKTSKKGRLELMYNSQTDTWETMPKSIANDYNGKFGWTKKLETVYENGRLVKDLTLAQVRANAGTF
jgi:nicotinamide phosphoribosyltransferase